MFNFFADESSRSGDLFTITGPDYNHIRSVLRMKEGDRFLVSCGGASHLCQLMAAEDGVVTARILEENCFCSELPVSLVLFQGLPKGDKMELIVQKCVELGVSQIVPVEMSRCVMKLDDKRKQSRVARWQAIAESAAKQSKRSVIPSVGQVLTYKQAVDRARGLDLILLPYEDARGMEGTREALRAMAPGSAVGIFIGPEGGFDPKEVELAREAGARIVSLGRRVLRTETAAVTAVGMCMLHAELELEAAP